VRDFILLTSATVNLRPRLPAFYVSFDVLCRHTHARRFSLATSALRPDPNNGAPGQLSFKYLMPLTQQCPVRLPAQLARRNRTRANVVQAWCAVPCSNAQFFLGPEQLLSCSRQPVIDQPYPTPVSELFRRKAFWFRGLRQKPGQCFVVCGRNLS